MKKEAYEIITEKLIDELGKGDDTMATFIFTGNKSNAELTAKIVKGIIGDDDFYAPISITQYEFNNAYPLEQWRLTVPNYPQDDLAHIADNVVLQSYIKKEEG